MADISIVKLPSGSSYHFKDSEARNGIDLLSGYAPKVVSTNMTSESLASETGSCICGYIESDVAGKAGWGIVRTYSMSDVAVRIIQIAELVTGERKTRFNNNGTWGAWA